MLYAIGDIHGHNDRLCALLNRLDLSPEDTVVFIGDYIDRGPDSAGVVETILALRENVTCVCLRGNHEQMLMEQRAYHDPNWDAGIPPDDHMLWFANGGASTLVSYKERFGERERWYQSIPHSHWDFYLSTLFEFGQGNFRFVHAGYLPDGQTWEGEELDLDPRLWIREPFLSSPQDFGGIVVFGHTPQTNGNPLFMANKIGIDTAVAYGGPLTALAINGDAVEVIQV